MSSYDRNPFVNDNRNTVKRISLTIILILFMISSRCYAADFDEIIHAQTDALDLEQLELAAQEFSPDMEWESVPDLDKGLANLFDVGSKALGGIIKKALRSSVLMLTIVLLSGLATSITGDGGKPMRASTVAAALALAAIAVADTNALIGMGSKTIEKMELFAKTLLPTIAAVTAASGSPGGAAARHMAAMLFSDFLMSLINRVLMPLVYVFIAANTAYTAVGNEGLKRISSTVKWLVTMILTAVLLAFVGYLSISGIIAGTTDAVTLKATKFTVSSMVPVVGGILSDAADTVLAGAGILKNSVGVFGMLVVLGMCIIPFLQLGIHYLMYKFTASISAMVTDARLCSLIDGIGAAFGLVLGMTGASALLLLVSMVSAIRVAAP